MLVNRSSPAMDFIGRFAEVREIKAAAFLNDESDELEGRTVKECDCECHKPGNNIRHFMACCEGRCQKCGKYWRWLKEHEDECQGTVNELSRPMAHNQEWLKKRKGGVIECDHAVRVRGGPHDGNMVHPNGDYEFPEPIYLARNELNEGLGMSGWREDWSEQFPAAYVFNLGEHCFDFWGWESWAK